MTRRTRDDVPVPPDASRDRLFALLQDANEQLVLAALRAHAAADEADAARAAIDEARRRLVVSERMASVGTLAAGVAHEINNPLAYVTANLDLVLEEVAALAADPSPARLREIESMVRQASDGAERVRRIVRGLQTFARPDAAPLSVVDVRDVLESSIDIAFAQVRGRARIVKDFGATPLVEADDARLGQVFINLLVNAAQAIPAGDAAAQEIRVVTATDAGGRAVVEVRDSGPGIPAEVLGRIFDPFFTTKPVGVGTGLGLSICHNIVSGMGGEIDVVSREGHGTVFRVALPATAAPPSPGPGATPPAPPTRRAVVLVVDDEAAVGAMIARSLRGHDVTVVGSARDAVALIEAGRDFDVILADLMMPLASGMDLHAELARRFPAAAARMVFVSGGAFTPAAAAFLAAAPNERLEKPFQLAALRALVERHARPPG